MEYALKFATKDQLPAKIETVGDKYFDKRGVLQPGYTAKYEVHHFALLALFQWGQENARVKKELYKKYKLRFITQKTVFGYEVKTLVSMMLWDEFNKTFKIGCIMGHLKKKGTSFEKLREKAELMLREQERLSTVLFMTGLRSGRKFHAVVRIQQWWLRKKRKFFDYKNVYQLMDEYSVEGGFTGQDSANYFGVGKGKNLLKIQEDIMKKVEMRRAKCREVSKKFVRTVLFKGHHRRTAACVAFDETVYGGGPCNRWAKDGGTEPYLCEPCATTDSSYPGGGRASGNLKHPRWAAQCSKCGNKNPYYEKERLPFVLVPCDEGLSCDEGPSGDEGPVGQDNESFWGKWGRRLGLHQR